MLLSYIKLFFKRKKWGLELVSLPHFLHYFWRKIFLTLCFINWPNFTAWLPLHIEILGNMCIVIICGVINFENNHSFLIKQYFYITKNRDKNINISRPKRGFNMKQKAFFFTYKEIWIVRMLPRFSKILAARRPWCDTLDIELGIFE